jgi:hypothetical protein
MSDRIVGGIPVRVLERVGEALILSGFEDAEHPRANAPVLLDDFEAQHPRGADGRFVEGDGDPETRAEEREERVSVPVDSETVSRAASESSKKADAEGTFAQHAHAQIKHEDAATHFLIRANVARKTGDQQAEREYLRRMQEHAEEVRRHNLILRRMQTGGRRTA